MWQTAQVESAVSALGCRAQAHGACGKFCIGDPVGAIVLVLRCIGFAHFPQRTEMQVPV